VGTESHQCWICGAAADSREHKFKRSDLQRASGSWSPTDQPSLLRENRFRRLQGPNSNLVKFSKNICCECNTTRTQAYDKAYEIFSDWAAQANSNLLNYDELDFSQIYGPDFEDSVLNLLKYVAKHFGCRVVAEGSPLPPDLAGSLKRDDLSSLSISFNSSTTWGDFPVRGTVGNYPVGGVISRSTGGVASPRYLSGFFSGYLDIIYHYDFPTFYPWEGNLISAPQRRVRFGHYDPANLQPHIANHEFPGARRNIFRIGDRDFGIPQLSREQRRRIMLLIGADTETTTPDDLDERIAVIHAMLTPIYPIVTQDYLWQHLTVPVTDEIFSIALGE
jgi:hypothetical protein